jgi:hypothetical protein
MSALIRGYFLNTLKAGSNYATPQYICASLVQNICKWENSTKAALGSITVVHMCEVQLHFDHLNIKLAYFKQQH